MLSLSFVAQNSSFSAGYLINGTTGFNFFTGPDAEIFKTTPKLFGSGVYDFSGQYTLLNFWIIKPQHKNIGLATTVAFKVNKFRFKNNLYFDTQNNLIINDDSPTRNYNTMFFSRHGSKLVTGKVHVPLMIYLPVSQWFGDRKGFFGIYGGAYYDGFLFAYHKLIFEENGQFVKNKTKNLELKEYFTKNSFGLRGGIKLGGFFIFCQYSLTPFFNSNLPYEIYETKVGLGIKINYFSWLGDKLDLDLDKDDNGIDAK